jgi:membrane-bound inhibitor of C-type lysozyme
MKRISKLAVLAAVLLGGCDSTPPPQAETQKIALKCGNYDVAIEVADADTLNTAINGEKITMYRAISASGAKYDGKGAAVSASLWNKGENWSLIVNNGSTISCKTQNRKSK